MDTETSQDVYISAIFYIIISFYKSSQRQRKWNWIWKTVTAAIRRRKMDQEFNEAPSDRSIEAIMMKRGSRVIEAALGREDWEGVTLAGLANNVNLKTAYGWMRTYVKDALPKKRGGARNKKITQLHVDAMTSYVEQDQLISLHLIKLNIFR